MGRRPPKRAREGGETMERNQFTFYRSYYEALKHLPRRDQTNVLMALLAYALDETEPSLSGVALSVFTLIRPTLDSGRNKAANRLRKQKSNPDQIENNGAQGNEEREWKAEWKQERETESEREGEREGERETPRADEGPRADSRADDAASVQADFLNRVNPSASQRCLDELGAFARELGAPVCRRAFDIALDSKKASWPYIRAILQDKHAKGVRCLADWDALEHKRARSGKGDKPDLRNNGTPGDYEAQALAKLLAMETP